MTLSFLPDSVARFTVPALVTGTHRFTFSSYLFSCGAYDAASNTRISFECCSKYWIQYVTLLHHAIDRNMHSSLCPRSQRDQPALPAHRNLVLHPTPPLPASPNELA